MTKLRPHHHTRRGDAAQPKQLSFSFMQEEDPDPTQTKLSALCTSSKKKEDYYGKITKKDT
jgi:hypothetical protein